MSIFKFDVLTDSPIAIRSNGSFLYFPLILDATRMPLPIFTERNLIILGDLAMKILSDVEVFPGSDIAQQNFIAVLEMVGKIAPVIIISVRFQDDEPSCL